MYFFTNLHSSMVRLETQPNEEKEHKNDQDLHSSMVRLETKMAGVGDILSGVFTFQYGQIRNEYQKIKPNLCQSNLHSSMVRLETFVTDDLLTYEDAFTFQYGQIRNRLLYQLFTFPTEIYIPVWLDQKHSTLGVVSQYV